MTPGDVPPARITLYWSALWRGAVSTMTFAVPVAVFQTWLVESDRIDKGDPTNLLLYLAIMSTGALGGFAAAKLSPSCAVQNGAGAAGLAALTIQLVADLRHLVADEPVAGPVTWIFLALLMSTFGMFGAWVNEKTTTRPSSPSTGSTT